MRAAWLACLLTGCYQPTGEAACTLQCASTSGCPAHLACRNGWCQDPNGAACTLDDGGLVIEDGIQPDGPAALCPTPSTHGTETAVVAGYWFGARIDAERYAIKFAIELDSMQMPIGMIRGTRDDVITGAPPFGLIMADDPNYKYRAPRLAPSGLEMYVRMEPMAAPVRIGRSVRTPGSDAWSLPAMITIANLALSTGDDPSPPTTTSPRHMVISHDDSMGFSELHEVGPDSWVVDRTQSMTGYVTPTTENVSFLGEAHLTEDGLRLVFRGQIIPQPVGAFYLERASVGVPFASPARQLPTLGSVSHPFWTSDCRYLLYDRQIDGQAYRVVYP